MLTTIKGIYDHGKIVLCEEPPVSTKTEVIITFLTAEIKSENQKRIPGGLKGKVTIPENFNEPLDDLKDYM